MSTRSTVTINRPQERAIHLYRHYDGGPWGNGSALARMLKQYRATAGDACTACLVADNLATKLIRTGDYELTTHADHHGDTEWHYDINVSTDCEPPTVVVSEIKWLGGDRRERQAVYSGDLAGFRHYVAEYQAGCRKRIAAYRGANRRTGSWRNNSTPQQQPQQQQHHEPMAVSDHQFPF